MTQKHRDVDLPTMEFFFNPRSIALIGASTDTRKPSGRSLNALLKRGYAGELYPINPRYQEIRGLPCYPSLAAVPGEVDMVIVSIPAPSVLKILQECIAKNVRAAVVFTSGFSEVGPEGKALQEKMTELVAKSNLRILGPNCVGLVNLSNSVMASFANIVDLEPVYPMNLGFVTQSGAFGAMIFAQAVEVGVGFSSFVSVGNEADTEFADFLSYLLTSPETKVIGGYLEGARNGKKFRRAAEEALKLKKPIVMIKVGRTGAGARAAASHTGSLAGDDQVYDAFFRQMGIIRIESLSELTSFVIVHRSGRLPEGDHVAVLSVSGGAGVLMADKFESVGLKVPEITGETKRKLETYLPPFGSAKNPVDMTSALNSDTAMMGRCLRALLADDGIHMIAANTSLMDHSALPMAKDLIEVYQSTTKPIVLTVHVFHPTEVTRKVIRMMQDAGMPVLEDHLSAVLAMKNLAWYADKVRQAEKTEREPEAIPPDEADLRLLKTPEPLSEYEGKKVLSSYGIPVTRESLATSAQMAVKMARGIGYPVALKIQSPQIMHKTEAGGIRLNLCQDKEVRAAFREITANARAYRPDAVIQGVLVQEMIKDGVEVIIGSTEDPVFGQVVMFGLGGVFVEALKDVSFRIAPLTRRDAEDMVREIRGYPVLQGMRGKGPVDFNALVEVILKVSRLVTDHEHIIRELDINPLVVLPDGARVADALIVKK